MPRTTEQFTQRLLAVLEKERAALLDGDLQNLGDFVMLKSEILDTLSSKNIPKAQDWHIVQSRLKENQRLIEAALNGLLSVNDKLQEARHAFERLSIYDPTGKKTSYAVNVPRKLERKA